MGLERAWRERAGTVHWMWCPAPAGAAWPTSRKGGDGDPPPAAPKGGQRHVAP